MEHFEDCFKNIHKPCNTGPKNTGRNDILLPVEVIVALKVCVVEKSWTFQEGLDRRKNCFLYSLHF